MIIKYIAKALLVRALDKSHSWLEIANMPLCCMCCGSRNVDTTKNTCLACGSTEGLWADERTTKEYEEEK